MKHWIQVIGGLGDRPRHLSYEEAVEAALELAHGEVTEAGSAAFLMALSMKGAVEDELSAFIDAFRSCSLPYPALTDALTCACSAEGHRLFPVSLPVSLLLASAGFPQVLHGGESQRPRRGACWSELLARFGVAHELSAKAWGAMAQQLHIGFLQTDALCPAIGRLKPIREQLGVRTIIDLIEQVINPVNSSQMIVGVQSSSLAETMIPVAMRSGFQQVYFIHGLEGTADLPLHQNSLIRIVTPWGDESRLIEPQKFGFSSEPLPPLDIEDQFTILQRVMDGEASDELKRERDHVIFNAGLRLTWFDKVGSYEEGFQLAEDLLSRKEAHKVMRRWADLSQKWRSQERQVDDHQSESSG
ncbi:anthranilate phosphoribosyltransferase [Paenibacillus aestuarii]|uniref:Anthranilate phosphoribosyltransferase n=1 Tax=Paenibacillus aestuarii TaxID=516965 RepID=A0ABW0K208_9BACL|nr:anthranilate phosphoribosyltransferase [Paenibacillus aestuarii]